MIAEGQITPEAISDWARVDVIPALVIDGDSVLIRPNPHLVDTTGVDHSLRA